MSFRIFASVSGGFHYQHDNCIDDSDFDTLQLVGQMQGMEPNLGSATETAAGIATPSVSIVDAMGAVAQRTFLELLCNGVDFVAMKTSPGSGWISVNSNVHHLLWTDTVTFAQYNFSPMDYPGTEFARAVLPSLADGMKNWGVLRQLALVINQFADQIGQNETPMLNIQLFK